MPTLVTRFVLSGIKEEVSPARRTVVDKVQAWGVRLDDETTDAIRLVVSELVTNAVLHGVGPVTVELCHQPGSLVIGVLDNSEAMPEVDQPALGAEGRRELGLVGSFAVRSGWEPVEHGKRVWAEVTPQASSCRPRRCSAPVLPGQAGSSCPIRVRGAQFGDGLMGRHAGGPARLPDFGVVFRPTRRDVDPSTGEPTTHALWDRPAPRGAEGVA